MLNAYIDGGNFSANMGVKKGGPFTSRVMAKEGQLRPTKLVAKTEL